MVLRVAEGNGLDLGDGEEILVAGFVPIWESMETVQNHLERHYWNAKGSFGFPLLKTRRCRFAEKQTDSRKLGGSQQTEHAFVAARSILSFETDTSTRSITTTSSLVVPP